MDKQKKQAYLDEAIRIGDDLLLRAEYDSNGASWETYAPNFNGFLALGKTGNIYSGSSGIALFLIELYLQTQNSQYLKTAVDAAEWAETYFKTNQNNDYSFFVGQIGLSYVYLRLHYVTANLKYLEKALDIARPCLTFLESPALQADLILGVSGTILGLLHLHQAKPDEGWLVDKIDSFVEYLIDKAQQGPVGLFWGRSPDLIKGLCGFSHGTAGVGYVFLELGHYFKDETFYWLAEQAFSYETYYYIDEIKNWPDFRCITSEINYVTLKEELRRGDVANFLYNGAEMNAWCHGAAGIGLSRLTAFDFLQKEKYIFEINNAIKKIVLTDIEPKLQYFNFTLCHGGGGNAELLIEAYKLFNDNKLLLFAETIADNALKYRQSNNMYLSGYSTLQREDLSLFSGNAGIGYFFLRLIDPENVPSILSPKIGVASKTRQTLFGQFPQNIKSTASFKRKIIGKQFYRTLALVDYLLPGKSDEYFTLSSQGEKELSEEFFAFIEKISSLLHHAERERLLDVYMLERTKREKDLLIQSYALLHMKSEVYRDNASNLLELKKKDLMRLVLTINPDVEITFTKWQWDQELKNINDNLSQISAVLPVLLIPKVGGIIDDSLSPFCYAILEAFKTPKILVEVVQALQFEMGVTSPEESANVEELILQQINELIMAQLLIQAQ